MNKGTHFSGHPIIKQLLNLIPRHIVNRTASSYDSDRYYKTCKTYEHLVSGLESDVCYVLNVSPKVYPSVWNLDNEEKIEEDRRVLYVALTRAKNELYITRDTNSINTVNNNENFNISSKYFLEELPGSLTEQIVNSHMFARPKDILSHLNLSQNRR